MRLSKSKIETYLACPQRFKWIEIDKRTDGIPNPLFEKGSLLHKIYEEYYITKEIPQVPADLQKDIENFKQYLKYTDYAQPLMTERKIIDDELDLSGVIDVVIPIKGKIYLLDYKTSKYCNDFDKYRLQLSIYQYLGKIDKIPIDRLGILFTSSGHLVTKAIDDYFEKVTKPLIMQIREDIDNKRFAPRINEWCKTCEFRNICELYQEYLRTGVVKR